MILGKNLHIIGTCWDTQKRISFTVSIATIKANGGLESYLCGCGVSLIGLQH